MKENPCGVTTQGNVQGSVGLHWPLVSSTAKVAGVLAEQVTEDSSHQLHVAVTVALAFLLYP